MEDVLAALSQSFSPGMLFGLNPLAFGRSSLGLIAMSVLLRHVAGSGLQRVKQLRLLCHGLADLSLRLAELLDERPVLFHQWQ
jgi:hypothetical protein